MPKRRPAYKFPSDLVELTILEHKVYYRNGKKEKEEWAALVPTAGVIIEGKSPQSALNQALKGAEKDRISKAKTYRKLNEEEIQAETEHEFAGEENPDPEEVADLRRFVETYYRVAV